MYSTSCLIIHPGDEPLWAGMGALLASFYLRNICCRSWNVSAAMKKRGTWFTGERNVRAGWRQTDGVIAPGQDWIESKRRRVPSDLGDAYEKNQRDLFQWRPRDFLRETSRSEQKVNDRSCFFFLPLLFLVDVGQVVFWRWEVIQ